MTQFTYPHVEDYIEIIAGYKNPDGKPTSTLWVSPDPLVSLARYDVSIVESLALQTISGTGYTDKQAGLAHAIAIKYERQLAKHNVSVDTIKTAAYRLPIRHLDRTSSITIDGDKIKLRFPYNQTMIDAVRAQAKQSQGSIAFSREQKVWIADLTESNLNWAYSFGYSNQFSIDSTAQQYMDMILESEQTPYKIELRADKELTIAHAEPSLVEYITEHLGGFDTENILRLVDNSALLGYTVDKIIEETVIEAYGPRFYSLCANRELRASGKHNSEQLVDEIVKYATETKRFPIFVYQPDLSDNMIQLFAKKYSSEQIVDLDKQPASAIGGDTQLVISRRIPKYKIDRIPLLVSSAGMLFGGDRQLWIQQAEKIVYFTDAVYNKGSDKGKELCKLV